MSDSAGVASPRATDPIRWTAIRLSANSSLECVDCSLNERPETGVNLLREQVLRTSTLEAIGDSLHQEPGLVSRNPRNSTVKRLLVNERRAKQN